MSIPAVEIFRKDAASEFRTRYALNALVMFIITAISVILFSLGDEFVSVSVLGGILWVIVFFSGMSGLSRTFVSEEERGTVIALQLIARPSAVFTGKLVFNICLTLGVNTLIAVLYTLLIDRFVILSPSIFWLTLILGSIGLASASTILAAIIAKANTKGTLFPVLAFPILLPLLLTVMNATRLATDGAPFSEALGEFQILIAYTVVVVAASVVLFDYVWKD